MIQINIHNHMKFCFIIEYIYLLIFNKIHVNFKKNISFNYQLFINGYNFKHQNKIAIFILNDLIINLIFNINFIIFIK